MNIRSNNQTRINNNILVKEVRLIDQNDQMIGVISTEEALRMARNAKLDLVEVSSNVKPPVCKILDYGKFSYHAKKNARKAKSKQKITLIKEMRFRPNIGVGDLQTKVKNIRKFLEEGDKVKVSIMFRGREITHKEVGQNLGSKIIEQLADLGAPEHTPKMEGQHFVMIFAPLKKA